MNPHNSRYKSVYAAAGAVAFLGLAAQAPGAIIHSTNPGVGAWSEPTNWDLGVAPVAGDDVRINNGGTAVIDDTTSAAALFVQLATAAASLGNLRMTGGTLTTTSDVRVGGIGLTTVGGTGTFDQSGGVINLNGGNVNVAIGPQTVGVYNLSGGSIQVNSSNIIAVGNRGTGTINQTGGTIYIRGTATNAAGGLFNIGRNAANATAVGNVNLSGGTIAAALVRYGNGSNSAGSTNSFTLSGTGRLITDSILVFANHNGTNLFNFNGGTLNAETISIPLTNTGGRLAPPPSTSPAAAASPRTSASSRSTRSASPRSWGTTRTRRAPPGSSRSTSPAPAVTTGWTSAAAPTPPTRTWRASSR